MRETLEIYCIFYDVCGLLYGRSSDYREDQLFYATYMDHMSGCNGDVDGSWEIAD